MEPQVLFNKIIIFYKDGRVHHARIEYKEVFGPNQIVDLNDYVYASELDKEMQKIMQMYRISDLHFFESNGLVEYRDYARLSQQEKEREENIRKARRREDFNNSPLSNIIDSLDNFNGRIRKRLREKNISVSRFTAVALAIAISLSATGFVIHNYFNRENIAIDKASKSITMISDDVKLGDADIDNIISHLSNIDVYDDANNLLNIDLIRQLFDKYESEFDSPIEQVIINKYKRLGGLSNLRRMSSEEKYNFCLYAVNLIMGGDNYSLLYGSSTVIPLSIEFSKGENREKAIDGYAKQYNVSREKILYAAVPGESDIYKNFPPLLKYAMICHIENVARSIKFDFAYSDKPSWWTGLYSSYNHDKLMEEISAIKERCITEIYNSYSQSASSKK